MRIRRHKLTVSWRTCLEFLSISRVNRSEPIEVVNYYFVAHKDTVTPIEVLGHQASPTKSMEFSATNQQSVHSFIEFLGSAYVPIAEDNWIPIEVTAQQLQDLSGRVTPSQLEIIRRIIPVSNGMFVRKIHLESRRNPALGGFMEILASAGMILDEQTDTLVVLECAHNTIIFVIE